MIKSFTTILLLFLLACNTSTEQKREASKKYSETGSIEKWEAGLDSVLGEKTRIEIIATGFDWSEGPLWLEEQQMLLFSDVPRDTVFQWTDSGGVKPYLTPSGYTGEKPRGGEMGSNGLLLDPNGLLVLCQHGNRQLARMDAPLDKPAPVYTSLVSHYQDKKLNSPNDAVYNKEGDIFFTDPPYGLETQNDEDPAKELPWNGVYKWKANGELILLLDSISRPNGIALFPNQQKLLVACSDPRKPNWYQFSIAGDSLVDGRIFYSAEKRPREEKGLPDGLKIDSRGIVYASGPGGVWIFDQHGKALGRIRLEEAVSNVALSKDEKTLFVTNDMHILRIRMRN
jgi:gluconolactonase